MLSKASKEHRLVIPVSFSLIENGRVTILIKNEYKLELLKQGILNPRQLITGSRTSDHNQLRGRGPLSSIPLEEKRGVRMVGKHCMRGGLIRYLTSDIFWAGNRPFEEMIANRAILGRGIKTAEIIAAAQQRLFGPFYRGYLFSRELSGCVDLITYFDAIRKRTPEQRYRAKAHIFEAVAAAFTTMHRCGIYHGDLHLKNVLIRPGNAAVPPEVYLIDFDKAVLKAQLSPREKIRNLVRFNRSIEKYRFYGGGITSTDQLKLCRAYLKGNSDVEPLLLKAMKRYRLMVRLRRLTWGVRTRGMSKDSHALP